ncbi:MAG: ligase-associated DNA damage response DEXH box helicase [Alphaproteobacteria bacterium]
MDAESPPVPRLPPAFAAWFEGRGWAVHPHQLAMLAAAVAGQSTLLIAPTGGGKTLAGFLPSLIELAGRAPGTGGLHTLYVSPLKALAVDIHRNLLTPIAEIGLAVTAETRTGDTPAHKRQRQRHSPPDILLTTPESLALMMTYADAPRVFGRLRCVVVDELHALAGSKRGDQLALCLARLAVLSPDCRRVGLSATVAWPQALRAWLGSGGRPVRLIQGGGAKRAEVRIHEHEGELPWSGHMGYREVPAIYDEIRRAGVTIVFVNTRAQAELIFQALWRINDDNLAIALHHGSLAAEQRRRVEAAMAGGSLRAVVATASLDLGIDWAAVDLVIQIGAPKGASRMIQRIGRAGHRLDVPSRALMVPANRFEVLECRAALEAIRDRALDGDPPGPGALDVLAQHVLCMAAQAPFDADTLYGEVVTASPYAALSRKDFDDVVAFCANGGYALGSYERWQRLRRTPEGLWRMAHPRFAQRLRMNIGTIVEAPVMTVRLVKGTGKRALVGGKVLGEIEDYFVNGLVEGDSFLFAGRLLVFQGIRENSVIASPGIAGEAPRIPVYAGGRVPLTTNLADRVRALLEDSRRWGDLPGPVAEWLRIQQWRSEMPPSHGLLVETFPRRDREYLVAYTFEGRNAHQTLGFLLTRRMERAGLAPLGFVATDYVIAVWSLRPAEDVDALFDEDMLGDDLEAWMAESSLLKRTFRNTAVIAGLIERRLPGAEKSGRQVTFSADLIYDVLRRHEPDHVLLRATRADAARGYTDVARLGGMLRRVKGRIRHRRLDRVSPLAVPVLLEVGKESVYGGTASDDLLHEASAEELIAEALSGGDQGVLAL